MNTLPIALLAAALSGCAAQAEPMICFEADKLDVAKRTAWSHMFYVVQPGPIMEGPDGRAFRSLYGYGHNQAVTSNGDGDLVPFTGSAVRGSDGRWLVSILGTLHQTSTYMVVDQVPEIRYWIISQNWQFDPPGIATGNAHIGNVIEPFGHAFPVTHDDSFDSFIQRIPCEEMP
jgi:hypothetical protein